MKKHTKQSRKRKKKNFFKARVRKTVRRVKRVSSLLPKKKRRRARKVNRRRVRKVKAKRVRSFWAGGTIRAKRVRRIRRARKASRPHRARKQKVLKLNVSPSVAKQIVRVLQSRESKPDSRSSPHVVSLVGRLAVGLGLVAGG